MDKNLPPVMNVFKQFGAALQPNVRLTKIECVDGHPPKIPIGQVIIGTLESSIEVGVSFNVRHAVIKKSPYLPDEDKCGLWCTSIIQKFLSADTFQTKNSIYKWEMITCEQQR